MRVKVLLIILILLSVTISCSTSRNSGAETTFQDYHKGSQGLVMRFLPDAPPARIFHSDPSAFNVNVEIQNHGTHTVRASDLKLTLTGFDRAIVPVSAQPNNPGALILDRKSALLPEGGLDIAQWRAPGTIFLPDNTDLYSPTLQVQACYRYQTQAAPVVCIDPDPYTAVKELKVCSVTDVAVSGGQGAPVAVTRVEPTIFAPDSGRIAQFKIYIQNVGAGQVLASDFGTLSRCEQRNLRYEDQNKVSIAANIGSRTLECRPQIVNLAQGRGGFTFCTLRGITADAAYTTPLEVTLDYNYRDSITKSIQIAKTPGESNFR
jgi:hypothetical protein